MVYSEKVNKAIKIATQLHDGQFRRGSTIPYIAHPFAVALLTQKYIDSEDVFIGGVLHDILEDVPKRIYTAKDLVEDFGYDILNIVQTVSEPNITTPTQEAWRARKYAYLSNIQNSNDIRPLIISACDKMHNMGELAYGYEEHGESIWTYFAAKREREIWFYESVLDALKTKILPVDMLEEYERRLEKLKSLQ
ncbi:bifunctional (p)ppGpp synthetase/guanosine-3',5'-bis(diphosphate) 3'-pyrophosphohydrolase [Candidatus Saccharibacteria bacterium]|nr:bifunctional (p)ppGpp synthetase/guanosine-3',5'-bis(diphosphate) 3'-pyrophosphohydrolase [Candidatus Saccharibacteria bacterium]MBP5656243.1 bifunctional (p)ppGpp synthetase/guanosine-3',5'-bis(diphosphate) 3'-pyrophosphohydrolase [Candidatus Saccharibacteria bacterium]